jgi:hypothetical protein
MEVASKPPPFFCFRWLLLACQKNAIFKNGIFLMRRYRF